MNRSPWRLEEVDGSPWRLEEVDGGDEQYPVESRFAVRHTPPDEQDPRFDRSAPTQVRFLRFAVRHTPPDQQDPRFDRRRSVSSVLRYATPLPINRTPVSSVVFMGRQRNASCSSGGNGTRGSQPAGSERICTYTFATRMTTLHTLRPGGSRLSGTSLRDRTWTVRGEADSWVHGRSKEVPPYYVQNNYSST